MFDINWPFFFEVLIGGLLSGVMYSLVALGFVLIYKASGVFNFAQSAMVFFAALTYVGLLELGMPALLAVLATLAVMVVLALVVGAQFVEALRAIRVPWSMFFTLALFFVPTFALLAGMMITIGSMVSETRQGQQIAGVLNMLFTLPFFFVVVFFTAPNSTLATILTIFPTTSFLTIALRWSMTTIPKWELIVGWIVVVASAIAMIWVASRVFRMGMLRYGQRLDVKTVVRALRTGAEG